MIGRHLRRLWHSFGKWAAAGAAEPVPAPGDGSGLEVDATAPSSGLLPSEGHHVDEVDRLVRLTFEALLGREPDLDTVHAYREGFANGTTFHSLVDDVLRSDEYMAAQARSRRLRAATPASPEGGPWELEDCEAPEAALARLETRLVEMGCRLNLGPPEGAIDDTDTRHRRRMRSLLVTLSMLDRP